MSDFLNTYKTPLLIACGTGVVILATHYIGCPFSGGCPFKTKKVKHSNVSDDNLNNNEVKSDSNNNELDSKSNDTLKTTNEVRTISTNTEE